MWCKTYKDKKYKAFTSKIFYTQNGVSASTRYLYSKCRQ